MKKNTIKIILYCFFSAMVASSIGFGSYFIYKAVENANTDDGNTNLGTPKTIWFNSGKLNVDESGANKDWDFQIKEYPYSDGSYWLDNDGLKLLRKEIKKKLYHGQEITTLDGMIFGNVNMIGSDSNGLYFPLTKETFFNIENWKNHKHLSPIEKIRGIMSTITHEYGHHIANMYLTTSYSNHSWHGDNGNIPMAKKADGSWDLTNWNGEFTETFYRTLHYDDESYLYSRDGIISDSKPISYNKTSIARYVSLHDLFWSANSKNHDLKYDEDGDIFGVPGTMKNVPKHYEEVKVANQEGAPNDKWYIKYRYTLDEIVTRQLEQLMYVYDIPKNKNFFGHMVREDGGKKYITRDSFLSDARSSSEIYRNITNNTDLINSPYYKDAMFSNKTKPEKIYNAFRDAMGYHKMISNIYGLNKTFATVDTETGSKYASYNDGDLNQHKFRITGWTPKEVKGIYYGDKNTDQKEIDKNLMKFPKEEERKKLWHFDRKDKLFAQKTIDSNPYKMNGDDWLPFSTNKYLDSQLNHKNNQEFRWWIDKDNNGKASPTELLSTKEILDKYNKTSRDSVINRVLPVSTFRQTWNEGDIFPRIRYLTDIEEGRKKLVMRLY